jgi:hypothetical protein
MKKKLFFLSFAYIIFSSMKVYSVDNFEGFKEICIDIGFKKNSEAFGDCVLELVSRSNKLELKNAEKLAAEQLATEKKLENDRQMEALERKQVELIDLQRHAIAAQENIAAEQRRTAGLQLMQKGLESLSGANRPAPVPILRASIECRTYGNRTTCD